MCARAVATGLAQALRTKEPSLATFRASHVLSSAALHGDSRSASFGSVFAGARIYDSLEEFPSMDCYAPVTQAGRIPVDLFFQASVSFGLRRPYKSARRTVDEIDWEDTPI